MEERQIEGWTERWTEGQRRLTQTNLPAMTEVPIKDLPTFAKE